MKKFSIKTKMNRKALKNKKTKNIIMSTRRINCTSEEMQISIANRCNSVL